MPLGFGPISSGPISSVTKDQATHDLAMWHFGVEPDLHQVIRIVADNEDVADEPIKLLEVNAATVVTGSVEPHAFAGSASVPFSTVIAEVTPELKRAVDVRERAFER